MPLVSKDDIRIIDLYPQKERACYDHPLVSLTWDANDLCWNSNPFCWDDVSFIIESFGKAVDEDYENTQWIETYQKLDKEKKKRFITLMVKVKGDSKEYEQKREVKEDIKVTAHDIKLTVEAVLDIKLDIKGVK